MSLVQSIALNETYHYIDDKMSEKKKKFHFLDQEYLDKFDEIINDKQLHAQIINPQIEEDELDELEEEMEDDFLLS